MSEATIKVEGMSCMHCVGRVKKAIEALKGIKSAEVQIGSVKVVFDEKELTKQEIEKAITGVGYKTVSA